MEFNYMLLDRLKSDCEQYLKSGKNSKCLWAGNEVEQIQKMKELYNSFEEDKRPKWLTYKDISNYEMLMTR